HHRNIPGLDGEGDTAAPIQPGRTAIGTKITCWQRLQREHLAPRLRPHGDAVRDRVSLHEIKRGVSTSPTPP
ncbi:MAG: hypothetical protein ABW080_18985, partial [Candidatus Thiodiazotropha sp.]